MLLGMLPEKMTPQKALVPVHPDQRAPDLAAQNLVDQERVVQNPVDLLHWANPNKLEPPLKADPRQKQEYPGGVIKVQKQGLHVHGQIPLNQIQVKEGLP